MGVRINQDGNIGLHGGGDGRLGPGLCGHGVTVGAPIGGEFDKQRLMCGEAF